MLVVYYRIQFPITQREATGNDKPARSVQINFISFLFQFLETIFDSTTPQDLNERHLQRSYILPRGIFGR